MTFSSRIFIKIMLNKMTESIDIKAITELFNDEEVKRCCTGMLPLDNLKNIQFVINHLMSMGLSVITEEIHEHLKVCFYVVIYYQNRLLTLCSECTKAHNGTMLCHAQCCAMLKVEPSSSDSSSDSDPSESDTSSVSDSNSKLELVAASESSEESYHSHCHLQ